MKTHKLVNDSVQTYLFCTNLPMKLSQTRRSNSGFKLLFFNSPNTTELEKINRNGILCNSAAIESHIVLISCIQVVEPSELLALGVSHPHTSHCMANGDVLISTMGDETEAGKGKRTQLLFQLHTPHIM